MSLSNDKELLRQIIISHYDCPNNKISEDEAPSDYIEFHNKSASCIDDFKVYIKLDNETIIDAKFSGVGCAISTASTDIFCDLLKNKSINDAREIFDNYILMIDNKEHNEEILGELIAFIEIHKQPNRYKCSMIGCDAFINALKGKNE